MDNNDAGAKVRKHREVYAASDRHMAFLTAISSTSGRIHVELRRLFHILSHRQTPVKFVDTCGEEPSMISTSNVPYKNFHNRVALGLACAQASIRTHVTPRSLAQRLD